MERDYSGSVALNRDLIVSGELVLAGGTFNQSHHSMCVGRYRQTGGKFVGGADLKITGSAEVSGGTLLSGQLITAVSLKLMLPAQ